MNIEKLNLYFLKNRDRIVKNNIGKYAVIYDEKVEGYFTSDKEAISFCSKKGFKLGEFIIKQCLDQKDEVQRFYSRVCFV